MKKSNLIFFVIIFLVNTKLISQEHYPKKPKLVIGIIIDQMRYDYLTRFDKKYGDGGFKRLLNNGFSLENAHYNYIPTYTAVGHASVFTGTTPSNHGIIGNNWFDKYQKKSIYCVDDENQKTIGNDGNGGKKSPHRLVTTSVADQLRLSQNMQGKSIGIAIKDRSAILPVGHTANAAYWFDGGKRGEWITSSYYMKALPKWVSTFNKLKKVDEYLRTPWNTLYDIKSYTESIEDENNYEATFKGQDKPTFPHNIPELRKSNNNYSIIKAIPAGNSFTTDFVKAAIIGENLGQSEHTDFLSISYSSTDYVGHQFGVASKEIEDTYLRLDKDLTSLFNFLDKKIGKDNYTLFLTADHAATQVPSYLESIKIPGNYLKPKKFTNYLNNITKVHFGTESLISNFSNFQIFLDTKKIKELKLNFEDVCNTISNAAIDYPGIYKVATSKTMLNNTFTRGIMKSLQNGYNQKFSGDILLVPNPSTIIYPKKGTTHGSGYSYDTHVPIIFYGKGIKQGASKKKYEIIDIAPTISNLLSIEFPNGNTGKIIEEIFR
ncbi:alkaline phosphatase PafA [Tenacibaculum sp. C7A-26P2]|uniref:alkaline phosphatase PafA n=1 Tax=Tenacibaculum sp. C7A-26P2 TaxID=3447504 RepID=UPI003F876531